MTTIQEVTSPRCNPPNKADQALEMASRMERIASGRCKAQPPNATPIFRPGRSRPAASLAPQHPDPAVDLLGGPEGDSYGWPVITAATIHSGPLRRA